MAKAEMALILSLVDEVTKTAKSIKGDLADVGKEAQGLKGHMADLGKGIAGLGAKAVLGGVALAATAFVALGAMALKAGSTIDSAMDSIAISTGATGDDLKGLGKDFETVFKAIPIGAETAAGVIGELNKTVGLTGRALTDIATPLAEASRMLGTDAAGSAHAFGQAMNAWKVEAKDAPGVLDMLFTASQKSGVGFDTLIQSVTDFGPTLRGMGFSITESAALLASLEKAGIPAATAMAGLRKAAVDITEAGEPLAVGLQTIIGKIQGADSATAALELGMAVFGTKAALPMVEAIRSGTFSLGDMTAALSGTEGAILAASQATQDWPEKLEILKNKATVALAPIGLGFMDIVSKILDSLMPTFDRVSLFLADTVAPAFAILAQAIGMALGGDVQGALEAVFGAATTAKIMAVVDAIGQMWGWLSQNWQPVLAGLAAIVVVAFGAWAAAAIPAAIATMAAMAPVILVCAAISLAVGLLVAAWTRDWGGIQEKTAAVVGWIQETVGAFLGLLRGWWSDHGEAVKGTVSGMWEGVKSGFSAALDWVKGVVSGALNAIKAWWQEHGDAVRSVVASFMAGIQTVIDTVFGFIRGIFAAFKLAFQGDWYGFGQKLRETWDALWAGVKLAFEQFKTALLGIWNVLKSTFGEAWERLKTTITETWNRLWADVRNALETAWEGLLKFIKALPGKIMAFFTETDWAQVGKDIIQGIVNGLQAMGHAIIDKIMEFIKAAWDAIRGFFGLSSPSRLMFGAGRNIMLGLAEGIGRSGGRALDALQNVMGEMGAAVLSGTLPPLGMASQPIGYGQYGAAQHSPAPQSGGDGGSGGGRDSGMVQWYSREALEQLFAMNAASITIPLAAAIAERLHGNDEDEMAGTLRALSAAG